MSSVLEVLGFISVILLCVGAVCFGVFVYLNTLEQFKWYRRWRGGRWECWYVALTITFPPFLLVSIPLPASVPNGSSVAAAVDTTSWNTISADCPLPAIDWCFCSFCISSGVCCF